MGRPTLIQKAAMRKSPLAEEFSPEERRRLRVLLRQLSGAPVVDTYLDCSEVAARLGFSNRTVRELAKVGAFDGPWGNSFHPQPNRLRIPAAGVEHYIQSRAARVDVAQEAA